MSDIKKSVELALEKIRPLLQRDGGDIELVDTWHWPQTSIAPLPPVRCSPLPESRLPGRLQADTRVVLQSRQVSWLNLLEREDPHLARADSVRLALYTTPLSSGSG